MGLKNFMLFYASILPLIESNDAAATKRQLCVEYVVENSRSNKTALATFNNMIESECLRRCAHHSDCNAYNLQDGGICEILPGLETCTETNGHVGSKFVHLGSCNLQVPWVVADRDLTAEACPKWHHQATLSTNICPAGMAKNPDGWACVALIPFKGLYLPGWYYGKYRFITDEAEPRRCTGYGYILRNVTECPVSWKPYTVGNPLPSKAVEASIWKDGTPLYFVTGKTGFHWYIGYLLPSVPRTFITKGMVEPFSPINVRILVYIWPFWCWELTYEEKDVDTKQENLCWLRMPSMPVSPCILFPQTHQGFS